MHNRKTWGSCAIINTAQRSLNYYNVIFELRMFIPVQIKSSTFNDSFEDNYLGEREVI